MKIDSPDADIFAGFDPLADYESPFMESSVSDIRTQYTQARMLREHWGAFGLTTRSAAGLIVLTNGGVPSWAVDGMRTIFSELRKVPAVADLMSDALRGIPKVVSGAVLDALASVPYVRLVVNLGIAIARIVQAARGQAAKEAVPESAELVYKKSADEKRVREILLALQEGDLTTIFSPVLAGEWEESPITWTIGGTNAQGRRFRPKRWDIEGTHLGFGCLPGLSEQEGWYEYAFEVDAPFTLGVVSKFGTPVTTLGSTHPSTRLLAATLWQAASNPSPQMFMVRPSVLVDRWNAYYASLSEFGLKSGGGPSTSSTQLGFQAWKMCSLSEIHRLQRGHTLRYTKSRFSGFKRSFLAELEEPDPLLRYNQLHGPRWPMTRLIRALLEQHTARMRPALGTIVCAYVPEDAPALEDDPGLAAYHGDMRKLLLTQPERCDVELELIPDAAYRNAMAQAQLAVNCGQALAGAPTPKGHRAAAKVDPEASPEPPPGGQGAPVPDAGDSSVVGALAVMLGLGLGALVFK